MKKIVMLHTVPMIIEGLTKLIKDSVENIEVENVLDEYLLKYVDEKSGEVEDRLNALVEIIKKGGADEIIITCSSLSEISRKIDEEVMMIDGFMHKEAIKYDKVLLAATAKTAIAPTKLGIERLKKEFTALDEIFIDGAMDKNKSGLKTEHDNLILEGLRDELKDKSYDALVLCQASMAHLKEAIENELDIKTLTNVDYFIKYLRSNIR